MASGPYRSQPALTDLQERFALGLSYGLGQVEAARVAGYAQPHVVATALARDDRVRAVVKARRNRRIDKMSSLALHVIESILRDPLAKSATRLRAAETVLGLAGHVAPKAADPNANPLNDKNISEMSIEELDSFIASEKAKRADAAKPVFDQETSQPPANLLIDKA